MLTGHKSSLCVWEALSWWPPFQAASSSLGWAGVAGLQDERQRGGERNSEAKLSQQST